MRIRLQLSPMMIQHLQHPKLSLKKESFVWITMVTIVNQLILGASSSSHVLTVIFRFVSHSSVTALLIVLKETMKKIVLTKRTAPKTSSCVTSPDVFQSQTFVTMNLIVKIIRTNRIVCKQLQVSVEFNLF
uniref:Uncharacterized protein n=1 Tax=Cacopsylla melanoneura TaxID=428564 RepID=A0A8D8YWP4_9HEMI